MSRSTRLAAFAAAVGADIKSLQSQINGISGGSDPWTYVVSTVDTANSTVTGSNITGLAIPTSLATGTYDFDAKLIVTSAATTTGVQLSVDFNSANMEFAALWQVPLAATTLTISNLSSTGAFTAGTGMPGVAPVEYVALLNGWFKINSTMTFPMQLQVRSEIAASEVRVKAGSYIRYRKIA